jgi:chromosome segregation ATPase
MPSFFDKVKSLVVEDDTPKKPTAPATQSTATAAANIGATAVANLNMTVAPADSTPALINVADEEKKIEELIQALPQFQKAAAFMKTVDSMKSVISDEATRINAARAALSADPQDLIIAVRSASLAIDAAKTDFEQNFVASKEHGLQDLAADSNSLQAKIDDLTKQLGELSTQKNATDQQLRDSHVALEKAKIDHTSVISLVTGRYTTLADKLAKYFGATNGQ